MVYQKLYFVAFDNLTVKGRRLNSEDVTPELNETQPGNIAIVFVRE